MEELLERGFNMGLKIIWTILLFLLGFMAVNNYFLIFKAGILVDDKILMLFLGLFLICAGIIIVLQSILLKFHKNF